MDTVHSRALIFKKKSRFSFDQTQRSAGVTSLGSNLASKDLKRTHTPHSLCVDFGGYKTFTTRWSGC